jgi:hypothetical protein
MLAPTQRHRQPAGIFGLKVDDDGNLSYLRMSIMSAGCVGASVRRNKKVS